MSLLKEYAAVKDVAEGLPWGGITMPFVMRQKDGSCFSVIEYQPYEKTRLSKPLQTLDFCRGWSFWSECQHTPPNDDRYFLVLCWNPFTTRHSQHIENTLGVEVKKDNFLPYFAKEAQGILREIQSVTTAKLLEYQDLMDFLSFTLSMGENRAAMPEVPLYMDALLSQDIAFDFLANDILVNGKKVAVLTLPSLPDTEELAGLVKDVPFRYVRRMLIFGKDEAKTEIKKYMGKWCPLRKTMRERIMEDILSNLNGYFYNGFIFHLEEDNSANFHAMISEFLAERHLPFLFEEFNLKDTWWGSLPGVFLANIVPPLLGLPSLESMLSHTDAALEEEETHRFRHLLDAMENDQSEKKGVDLEYVQDGPVSSPEGIPQVHPALRAHHS